jgi:competence protein ComEA
MNERSHRALLWIGVLILTISLYIPKGHEAPPVGASSVAFVQGKPESATVRIIGDIPHPGLYQAVLPANLEEIIRQAAPEMISTFTNQRLLSRPLADGDLVTITTGKEQGVTVMPDGIPVRERIVLGIPLNPARMKSADWDALPGIGPALTRRIITCAKQRGGIRSLDDLQGIDGIGSRTMKKLQPLFDYPHQKSPP